jgi:hypothetical protein
MAIAANLSAPPRRKMGHTPLSRPSRGLRAPPLCRHSEDGRATASLIVATALGAQALMPGPLGCAVTPPSLSGAYTVL